MTSLLPKCLGISSTPACILLISLAASQYHGTKPFTVHYMKTRAIIHTAALANNLALIHAVAPSNPVLAIVKADAYGHGATGLLSTVVQHSDALAVARLEEAKVLRDAHYVGRMILMCGVSNTAELSAAIALQLDIVVHDPAHLSLLAAYDYRAPHKTHLWLKMDSSMHRLGFCPEHYAKAFQQLRALSWRGEIIGMTHFSCADEPEKNITAEQIHCYSQHTRNLALDNHSLANSAGILAWPTAHRGWLRPGLMMYGINPLEKSLQVLQPVMQLEAQIIATRTIPAGETTGYNQRWCAERDSLVAFVAAGYADGYPITALNNSAVGFNGQRAPVIGRVSMDTLAIDCTDLFEKPVVDDYVELWGNTIAISEVAKAAGSIPYQLLTSVSSRVQRVYR